MIEAEFVLSRLAIFGLLTFLAPQGRPAPTVVAVDVDGIVHPITTEIVSSAIDQAQRQGASLVLIRLNTPGGLMEAMRGTIAKILSSPVPVVTYVTPSGARAASAGFFLLEAGDVAAMASGTNTGAAHPVVMGGQMDAVMKQKVENDAAAYLRSISAKRGRNSELAQKAVFESRSFTEQEALAEHLIDLLAPDEQHLLTQLEGRSVTRFDGRQQVLHTSGASITVYEKSLRQSILAAIADPNIALVLLVLGALGIYAEFSAPGLIAPGVGGAILVLLGLSALSVLPINWLGAALLLLALTLFVLEAKFVSHGILGIGGTVAMILGAMLLVDSPVPEMRIRLTTAIALALPFSAITMLLVSLVIRARRAKVVTGADSMIGEIGTAITRVAPEGKIFVRGEYWDAVASTPIETGAQVRVRAIDKLKLTVEPLP
ncbi:MAG TPA: nodulation protein NfeD [Bryobacteraceae bacterium]|nr:nodulation protein NfeD [Bryobacteraceae bacterium]